MQVRHVIEFSEIWRVWLNHLKLVLTGSPTSTVKRTQSNLTPITEEDGISESLSSDRSSVPDSGHLNDNQPLLKKANPGVPK